MSQTTENKTSPCQERTSLQKTSIDLFSGGIAGTVGIIVGFPFDIVKVRLQSSHGLYSSAMDCAKKTIKHEGFLGLYKGALAPILAQSSVNSLLFAGESWALRLLEPDLKPGELPSNHLSMLLAGGCGGVLQLLTLVPSEVIKCKLQVDNIPKNKNVDGTSQSSAIQPRYKGMIDCGRQILRNEGFFGLYKGTTVTAWREVPSISLYFYSYRYIKDALTPPGNVIMMSVEYLVLMIL